MTVNLWWGPMSSFPKRKEFNYSEYIFTKLYIYIYNFSFYHVFLFMIGIVGKANLIIEIANIH